MSEFHSPYSRLRQSDAQPSSEPETTVNGDSALSGSLTARQGTHHRQQEKAEILSAVFEAFSDAVICTDVDGRVVLFNPAAERIFQINARDIQGRKLDRLLPQRLHAQHDADMKRFASSSRIPRSMGLGLVTGLRADGQELLLEASITRVTVQGAHVLTAIMRDVTARIRAEQETLQYHRGLSELNAWLMEHEQATTRRVAQLLHDGLGQTLTAIRLSFDALAANLEGKVPGAVRERLSGIDRLTQQAVLEVRQALVDLRPPLLEAQGLAVALDNEVRMRQADIGVRVRLEVVLEAAGQRWPDAVEYAAFMVAREAVLNAMQHAGSDEIRVRLAGPGGTLQLDVIDNGPGIHLQADAVPPGHLGMVGMHERAAAIGARLTIQDAPPGGTHVQLQWGAAG